METPHVASHTWRLQVTTTLSQHCGLQMWGFPKELAEIDYRVEGGVKGGNLHCSLRMEGEDVFHFCTKADGNCTPEPITSTVYSIFEGAPHVSHLTQSYRDTGFRKPSPGR